MRRWFVFVLVGLSLFPFLLRAETVTLVADTWCPYNCEPGANYPGFMIEIAQKAFAKHNIDISYSTMPWTRAIEETREHKHTAIVGASRKDAPDFIFPAVPQGWMRNGFYVKTGSAWKFAGIGSLDAVSLGVIANYSYNDELDAYIAKHANEPKLIQKVSGDDALDSNVKKLLAGRIGALIEGQYVVDYYVSKHDVIGQLVQVGALPPSEADQLYIAFSPKEPNARKYADIMATEMQAMRKSGELKEILTRYSVADWQK